MTRYLIIALKEAEFGVATIELPDGEIIKCIMRESQ